jgi:hypothetical protein
VNVKGIFKAAFPFISAAAAAGGPLGTMAANAIGKTLGADKVDDIEQAIAGATPEQMVELKKTEDAFALQMAQLKFESVEKIEEISAADRDSARKREIAVRDKTPMIIAFAITGGFFTLLFILVRHAVPEGSRDVLNIMLGSLGTAFVGIINYYFGSSAGSAEKTKLLAEAGKS